MSYITFTLRTTYVLRTLVWTREYDQATMISDTTLTQLTNGLGITAMVLVVTYHFVAVNARRTQD